MKIGGIGLLLLGIVLVAVSIVVTFTSLDENGNLLAVGAAQIIPGAFGVVFAGAGLYLLRRHARRAPNVKPPISREEATKSRKSK